MEEANQVAFEALPLRLVAFQCPADGRCHGVAGSGAALTVSDAGSTAAMRRGSRSEVATCDAGMRRPLPPQLRSRSWSKRLRPGLQILNRRPLASLRYRLRVDLERPAQRRERSLRSLYLPGRGERSHAITRDVPALHGFLPF